MLIVIFFALVGKKFANKYMENVETYREYVGFLREYSIAVDITKRAKKDVLSEFNRLNLALSQEKIEEENILKAITFINTLGKDNTQIESKSVKGEYIRAQDNLVLLEQEGQKKSKCAIAISIAIGLMIVILIV